MSQEKYAIVRNGEVENVILWNGDEEIWQPPEGAAAILLPEDSSVGIGYTFDGEQFVAPPIVSS
ncbi:hypothetical protein [Burkholderia pyrrocinia]|uniref:hypothetical protein n=1 Tax=Burkholderia pyrrocinia TaxID=60550 RepID=UPI002AB1AFFA|nr:hypothetical protein [Burkholderia pyrrocinia]